MPWIPLACVCVPFIYLFIGFAYFFFHLSMVYGRRPLQTWSEWIIVGIRNRGMNKGCTRLPAFFCFFTWWNVCDEIHALVYVIGHQPNKRKEKKYFQRILMAQGIEQNRTPSSGQSRPKSPTLFATSSILDPRI